MLADPACIAANAWLSSVAAWGGGCTCCNSARVTNPSCASTPPTRSTCAGGGPPCAAACQEQGPPCSHGEGLSTAKATQAARAGHSWAPPTARIHTIRRSHCGSCCCDIPFGCSPLVPRHSPPSGCAQVVAASRLGREDLPGLHAIFQHLDAGGYLLLMLNLHACSHCCSHRLCAECWDVLCRCWARAVASHLHQELAPGLLLRFRCNVAGQRLHWLLSELFPSNTHAPFSSCRQVRHADCGGAAGWAAAAGQVGDRRKPGVKSGVRPIWCG